MNFYKVITKKDSLRNQCIKSTNQHQSNNKEKRNLRERKRIAIDVNYRLISNIRKRTYQAFKSQNVTKLNKTFVLIGFSQSFFKRWIIDQLYGEMTLDNYGKIWCLDHCYPLYQTNLSNETDMIKATIWIILKPMYFSENIAKADKTDHRLYLLQQIKAKNFLNLNE